MARELAIYRLEAPRGFRLTGDLSSENAHVLKQALAADAGLPGDVVFDLAGLTFVDTIGLHVIARAATDLAGSGRLILAGVEPWLRRLLVLAGMDALPNVELSDRGDTPTGDRDDPPRVPQLVHEALVYSTPDDLAAVAMPFLRDAVDRGERAFVVTWQSNAAALRAGLGAAAEHIDWADAAVWSPKPIDRIQALDRYVGDCLDAGAPRVRIIDESPWPEDSTAAVDELKRFESIVNLLFAPRPVWMICPYNASLFNHILPDAYRTHPLIRDARVSRKASVAYLEPKEFFQALDAERELAPAPPDARVLRIQTPREIRDFVVAEASAAGLHRDRIGDLELAACEMATNAIRHGREGAEAAVWTAPDEIVCQVSDAGAGMKDRLIGYDEPSDPDIGGWGLLLARRLCDGVEVRSTPGGTVIRLSMKLPGSPHPS